MEGWGEYGYGCDFFVVYRGLEAERILCFVFWELGIFFFFSPFPFFPFPI